MKQITFRCVCCRRLRPRNPRVKIQKYCGSKSCQQARKNKWQREKQQTDPDYRANKKESQSSWQERNPGYWKQYRSNNSEYCEMNRRRQKIRDHNRRCAVGTARTCSRLAKKDALEQFFYDTTESYYILPVVADLAKKDALTVKIIPTTVR